MKKQKLNSNKGITLIALIITIIVLLILAIVSVKLILDQGIIKKSEKATNSYQIAQEKELITLGYDEYKMAQANKENLSKPTIEGASVGDLTNGSWNIVFQNTKNQYTLKEEGTIEGPTKEVNFEEIQSDVLSNPDQYLEKAKELGQNTIENVDIGIGTDGNVVNLDLWIYSLNESNTVKIGNGYGSSNGPAAYKGTYTEEGAIEGTIPQLIYSDGIIYTVTATTNLFRSENLKIAPNIPSTVTDCNSIFYRCSNLTKAPEIPSGVTNLCMAFEYCTNLIEVPELPDGVTNCTNTFQHCTSLITAPKIPNSTTDCEHMFGDCTNLKTAPVISSNVEDCSGMFWQCTNLTTAPVIPNNVIDCGHYYGMFAGCSSLTGTITINSTPTKYKDMLRGVGSADHPITLTGDCSKEVLEAIKQTGNADYITVDKE